MLFCKVKSAKRPEQSAVSNFLGKRTASWLDLKMLFFAILDELLLVPVSQHPLASGALPRRFAYDICIFGNVAFATPRFIKSSLFPVPFSYIHNHNSFPESSQTAFLC
ncbi:hypothetical protein VTO42DRAFT_1371 [Malbranchea cinnamomea]